MKHLVTAVPADGGLAGFLARDDVREALAGARAVLVQIFAAAAATGRLPDLVREIRTAVPAAVIVGASSGGEIEHGYALSDSLVVSVSCFDSSTLHPVYRTVSRGEEDTVGAAIGAALRAHNPVGVLLLAPPMSIDCARLIASVATQLAETPVFGGAAAGSSAYVLYGDQVDEQGVVAVGLCGDDLHIDCDVSFGWEGLGPAMTLTDVDGFHVRTIDDKPAFDVYRRYLNVEPGEELYLLEFPLLIEREGVVLARNPVSTDDRGGVTLVADAHRGESVRLGFLDIDASVEATRGAVAVLARFAPQAVYLYSCICRKFTLQQDIEMETRPYERLAPVAGFFTYGEFAPGAGRLRLLNSCQVVVALREGEAGSPARDIAAAWVEPDRYRMRHIRITSRLFQFVSALTDELQDANRALHHQAEHDALTGARNRRLLSQRLRSELSRVRRHGGSAALVMFDLDHFKRINDKFGHAAGDEVLKNLARLVRESMREHDELYRYGGEEFLLLLPETGIEGALTVAEKVRRAVEAQRFRHDGKALPVITVSVGVACLPDNGTSPPEALGAVDAALYRAKQRGRNCVVSAKKADAG